MTMPRDDESQFKRVSLRIPDDLHARAAAAAARDRRSLNSELLFLIERGLDAAQGDDQGG
jgi:predicted HicB family RNase H-like nuclease